MIHFTRATAADWAPRGVTVNAICPGLFMTEPNLAWSKTHPEVIETFVRQVPMGRTGEPDEIGPLAVYLASDASNYVTGASLWPRGGSWNPTMTMVALSQHLADYLAGKVTIEPRAQVTIM